MEPNHREFLAATVAGYALKNVSARGEKSNVAAAELDWAAAALVSEKEALCHGRPDCVHRTAERRPVSSFVPNIGPQRRRARNRRPVFPVNTN